MPQQFGPDEQRCISAKISTLMSEGKPQDQAIAIAISQCAPEKVKASEETVEYAASKNQRQAVAFLQGILNEAKEMASPEAIKRREKTGMKPSGFTKTHVREAEGWLAAAKRGNTSVLRGLVQGLKSKARRKPWDRMGARMNSASEWIGAFLKEGQSSESKKFEEGPAPLPGRYKVEQTGDRYAIRGVPIFATHVRNLGGKSLTFDETWLKAAVAVAQERKAGKEFPDGNYPRLHVRHHEAGAAPEGIGYLDNFRIGTFHVDGEDRPTLFADFVDLEEETLADIRERRLPYVSVELADPLKPEISSAALLPTESPYFKFPVITLHERPAGVAWALYAETPSGAYVAALDWRCCQMPPETKFQDEEMPEGEAPPAEEEAPEGTDAKLDQVLEMLSTISQQVSALAGAETAEMQEPVSRPAEASEDTSSYAEVKEHAQAEAKILHMDQRLRTMETDKEIQDGFALLRTKRIVFDETAIRGKMLTFAEKGMRPLEFAEILAENGVQAPSPAPDLPSLDGLPAEVLAYKDRDPTTFQGAVGAWKEWQNNKEGDLASWIAQSVDGFAAMMAVKPKEA